MVQVPQLPLVRMSLAPQPPEQPKLPTGEDALESARAAVPGRAGADVAIPIDLHEVHDLTTELDALAAKLDTVVVDTLYNDGRRKQRPCKETVEAIAAAAARERPALGGAPPPLPRVEDAVLPQAPRPNEEGELPAPRGIALEPFLTATAAACGPERRARGTAEWRAFASSGAVRALFGDVLWWLVVTRFVPDDELRAALYARIAARYTRLMAPRMATDAAPAARDAFQAPPDEHLRLVPALLAGTACGVLAAAYPGSEAQFGHAFRLKAVAHINSWRVSAASRAAAAAPTLRAGVARSKFDLKATSALMSRRVAGDDGQYHAPDMTIAGVTHTSPRVFPEEDTLSYEQLAQKATAGSRGPGGESPAERYKQHATKARRAVARSRREASQVQRSIDAAQEGMRRKTIKEASDLLAGKAVEAAAEAARTKGTAVSAWERRRAPDRDAVDVHAKEIVKAKKFSGGYHLRVGTDWP